MFVINVGLGARPGDPPNSIQKRALNLLHATQWAAHMGAQIRLVGGFDPDPTVVLSFDRKPGHISFKSEVKALMARCDQSVLAVFDSHTGQREFIGAAWPEKWDDEKFHMPQAHHTLRSFLAMRAAAKGASIPRRDYGPKGAV